MLCALNMNELLKNIIKVRGLDIYNIVPRIKLIINNKVLIKKHIIKAGGLDIYNIVPRIKLNMNKLLMSRD